MSRWSSVPLKRLFLLVNGSTPASTEPDYWDGDISWATPEDLGKTNGRHLTATARKITRDGYESCGTTLVRRGSLILTTRAPVGNIAIASIDVCTNQGCKALEPLDEQVIDSGYFYYLLRSRAEELQSLSRGSTFVELSTDELAAHKVLLPDLVDQQSIAAALDIETQRIDALIAEKRLQLELLAEKRRALITHAVTQGLNSDAPRRESGISWLGKIPAHWQIKRLKFVAEVRGGLTLGKDYGTQTLQEFPYMRVANVQDGFLDLSKVITVMVPAAEAAGGMLENGDVLMNEGGDIDKLGRGCVWRMEIANCLHQNHVFCVRPFAINSDWLDAWTSTESAKHYFESRAKRATNLASISGSNIKELPVPLPPEPEQLAILEHMATETRKLADLADATERTIALLHERRSALISAAVSGQLLMENADARA